MDVNALVIFLFRHCFYRSDLFGNNIIIHITGTVCSVLVVIDYLCVIRRHGAGYYCVGILRHNVVFVADDFYPFSRGFTVEFSESRSADHVAYGHDFAVLIINSQNSAVELELLSRRSEEHVQRRAVETYGFNRQRLNFTGQSSAVNVGTGYDETDFLAIRHRIANKTGIGRKHIFGNSGGFTLFAVVVNNVILQSPERNSVTLVESSARDVVGTFHYHEFFGITLNYGNYKTYAVGFHSAVNYQKVVTACGGNVQLIVPDSRPFRCQIINTFAVKRFSVLFHTRSNGNGIVGGFFQRNVTVVLNVHIFTVFVHYGNHYLDVAAVIVHHFVF